MEEPDPTLGDPIPIGPLLPLEVKQNIRENEVQLREIKKEGPKILQRIQTAFGFRNAYDSPWKLLQESLQARRNDLNTVKEIEEGIREFDEYLKDKSDLRESMLMMMGPETLGLPLRDDPPESLYRLAMGVIIRHDQGLKTLRKMDIEGLPWLRELEQKALEEKISKLEHELELSKAEQSSSVPRSTGRSRAPPDETAQTISNLQKKVSDLQFKCDAYSKNQELFRREREILNGTIVTLNLQTDNFRKESSEWKSQHEASLGSLSELQKGLDSSVRDVLRLKDELNEAQSSRADLSDQLALAQDDRDQQVSQLNAALEALRLEFSTAENTISQVESQRDQFRCEIMLLQEREETSKRQIADLQAEWKENKLRYLANAEKSDDILVNQQFDLYELEQDISKLRAELNESRQHEQSQKGDLERLRDDIVELHNTHASSISDLKLSHANDIATLNAQNLALEKTLENEKEDLRKASEAHEHALLTASAAHEVELSILREELQTRSDELKGKSEELQTRSDELKSKSEELQTRSDELRSKSEELQTRSDELKGKSEELQAMSDELKSKSDELQTKSDELESRSKEHAKVLSDLKTTHDEEARVRGEEIRSQQSQLDQLQSRLDSATTSNSELKERTSGIEAALANLAAHATRPLAPELADLSSVLVPFSGLSSRSDVSRIITQLEGVIDSARASLVALHLRSSEYRTLYDLSRGIKLESVMRQPLDSSHVSLDVEAPNIDHNNWSREFFIKLLLRSASAEDVSSIREFLSILDRPWSVSEAVARPSEQAPLDLRVRVPYATSFKILTDLSGRSDITVLVFRLFLMAKQFSVSNRDYGVISTLTSFVHITDDVWFIRAILLCVRQLLMALDAHVQGQPVYSTTQSYWVFAWYQLLVTVWTRWPDVWSTLGFEDCSEPLKVLAEYFEVSSPLVSSLHSALIGLQSLGPRRTVLRDDLNLSQLDEWSVEDLCYTNMAKAFGSGFFCSDKWILVTTRDSDHIIMIPKTETLSLVLVKKDMFEIDMDLDIRRGLGYKLAHIRNSFMPQPFEIIVGPQEEEWWFLMMNPFLRPRMNAEALQ